MAIDWANLGSGALAGAGSGAGIGASIGSVLAAPAPGLGAGIGAGVGGLAGILLSLLGGGGKEGGPQRLSAPNEQEQSILDYLLKSGQQGLENPSEGFEPIRQDALNTFHQDIVPYLTNMFDASGSSSASSPVLQSNLSSAGSGLAQKLAALEANYRQGNQHDALSRLSLGLSPAFQTDYRATQHGTGTNLLNSLLQSKGFSSAVGNAPSIYKQYLENRKLANQAKG